MHTLIVDDDIATVEVIRDSIPWPDLGIDRVDTAYNINDAKLILKEQRIDIVISDIEMPQGTGLDLLTWIRQNEISCEFLLLTCHEDFSYAANAIRLNAAEYLVKPFDPETMAMSLRLIVHKIREARSLRASSEYGAWLAENPRQMLLSFWSDLLSGKLSQDPAQLNREILGRRLAIDPDRLWRLVCTRLTNSEQDETKLGLSLLQFAMESIQSEIIGGHVENERVIRIGQAGQLTFLTVVDGLQTDEVRSRCAFLIDTCRRHFKATLTCCIGQAGNLADLPAAAERLQKTISQNVAFNGKVFTEDEAVSCPPDGTPFLDLERVNKLLAERDKNGLLNEIKGILQDLAESRRLSEHALYLLNQELLQAVYSYMMPKGIKASRLFFDQTSEALSDRATQSAIDMIRWTNFMLGKTFDYEEEILKSSSLIEKINAYIRGHYQENIGRNEIAAAFYLAPEYLAKVYKKKTGQYLRDTINEYRIGQARLLLQNPDTRISDVAAAVGFENFSYFSTMFKKYTGMTPNEYRKDLQAGDQSHS